MPGSDLLWWIIGGLFALVGVPLCIWALWADRLSAAGRNPSRRRCPRCWYDLRATPGLTCSECGLRARHERTLRRRRRRWRGALAGVSALMLAMTSALVPMGRQGRLWPHVPTTVILGLEYAIGEFGWERLTLERHARLERSHLWNWQIRSLAARAARDVVLYRASWPDGLTIWTCDARWGGAGSTLDRFERHRPLSGPSHEMVWDPGIGLIRDSEADTSIRLKYVHGYTTDSPRTVSVDLPVRRVPTIDEAITPVRDPALDAAISQTLQPRLVHLPYRNALVLVVREPTFTTPDIAVGLRVSFERDGEVLATARMFTGTTTTVGDMLPGVLLEGDAAALAELKRAEANDPRWRVRIESDGEMALRDFGATHYWSGGFTLPLSAVKK